MQEKDNIYYSICTAILKLEIEKGHLNWKITDVAKVSGVTRSLIYYYFGKEKDLLIIEAYRFLTMTIFNLDGKKKSGSVIYRLKTVLESFETMPYLFVLYYLKKNEDSEIGELLRKSEADLINYLQTLFPKLSKEEIFELYLKELGAIAYRLPGNEVSKYFSNYK